MNVEELLPLVVDHSPKCLFAIPVFILKYAETNLKMWDLYGQVNSSLKQQLCLTIEAIKTKYV